MVADHKTLGSRLGHRSSIGALPMEIGREAGYSDQKYAFDVSDTDLDALSDSA